MKAVAALLRALSQRRLRLRVKQLAALAGDPLATVYPEALAFPGGQRVLVLAPHADDETYGMAGTMLRHLEAGDELHVLLFSDNSDSLPGAGRGEARTLRTAEFRSAMRVLGVADTDQCALPPEAFVPDAPPPRMRSALIGIQPHVLYLPSLFDNHAQHRVVAQWAAQELSTTRQTTMRVRGYEVWTPLPATVVTDITAHIETKREAMRCYESQNQMIDYIHHVLGLNAYRAITLDGARYAEAFLETAPGAFHRLVSNHYAS